MGSETGPPLFPQQSLLQVEGEMAELGPGDRVRELTKKRQTELDDLEEKKKELKEQCAVSLKGGISSKFAVKSDYEEENLKTETFGLVTHEEFVRKQQEMKEQRTQAAPDTVPRRKRKRLQPTIETSKLSFGLDDEEEQEEVFIPRKKRTFGKNPMADTSFLPDKERELWEKEERERLKKEWTEEQERIKREKIPVTYSYWDGSGHRRTLEVEKGTTVEKFLELVRQDWRELRGVSIDSLLFVKEDLIVPHDISFYELILTKARGKSGPLFDFDVHEDIRLMSDATREKAETHAAKVVERRWYERNKHIFPASRWEVYDPKVQREKYTIRDRLEKH